MGVVGVEVVRSLVDLAAIAPAWTALWQSMPHRQVFQHPSWVHTWASAFRRDEDIFVLVARDDDRVVGVLPLVRRGRRVLEFAGVPRSDYHDVICGPEDAARVVEAFCTSLRASRRRDWTHLELAQLGEHSVLRSALEAGAGTALDLECTAAAVCPVAVLDAEGSVAEAITQKKSLRRHERKLQRLGEVEFVRFDTTAERRGSLSVLFDQHVARWCAKGVRSQFCDDENRRMYELLVTDEALAPFVRFEAVLLDGRPAALHLGFEIDRRITWYKPTFDLNLEKAAPGEVLLLHLFRAAAREGATEVDFTRGAESFKSRFATNTRQNVTYRTRRGPVGRVLARARGSRVAVRLERSLGDPVGTVRRVLARARRARRERVARSLPDDCLFFRSGDRPEADALPDGIELEVGPVDLVALGASSRWNPGYVNERRMRRAAERRQRDDVLIMLKDATTGQPLHYLWLSRSDGTVRVSELGRNLTLPDSPTIFGLDGWTSPTARGRGLLTAALRVAIRVSLEMGRPFWGHCREVNHASKRALLRSGLQLRFRATREGEEPLPVDSD